jgi:hypothetical protein
LQNTEENSNSNKEILELLVKQNKQILALTENSGFQNIQNFQQNIQQNIQNNMTFNLNYFLNEKCKNAINMSEFIESSEANFNDLENTGKNGLVKSLTQFIIKELSKLNVFERPIHCSDTRRKILHIKDKNQWQKDTEGQTAYFGRGASLCYYEMVVRLSRLTKIPPWASLCGSFSQLCSPSSPFSQYFCCDFFPRTLTR